MTKADRKADRELLLALTEASAFRGAGCGATLAAIGSSRARAATSFAMAPTPSPTCHPEPLAYLRNGARKWPLSDMPAYRRRISISPASWRR